MALFLAAVLVPILLLLYHLSYRMWP